MSELSAARERLESTINAAEAQGALVVSLNIERVRTVLAALDAALAECRVSRDTFRIDTNQFVIFGRADLLAAARAATDLLLGPGGLDT